MPPVADFSIVLGREGFGKALFSVVGPISIISLLIAVSLGLVWVLKRKKKA